MPRFDSMKSKGTWCTFGLHNIIEEETFLSGEDVLTRKILQELKSDKT